MLKGAEPNFPGARAALQQGETRLEVALKFLQTSRQWLFREGLKAALQKSMHLEIRMFFVLKYKHVLSFF